MMLGSLSETAMSSMRPPMLAGPIDRNLKLANIGSCDWLISRGVAVAGAWPRGATMKSGTVISAPAIARRAKVLSFMAGILLLREPDNTARNGTVDALHRTGDCTNVIV